MRTFVRLLAVLLLPLALLGAACGDDSDDIAKAQESQAPSGAGRLLVADPMAEVVYLYDLPGYTKVAEFANTKLSTHLGAMALPDGRTVFVDDKNGEVVVLDSLANPPSVLARAKAPSPAIWGAVDPGLTHFVYSSNPNAEHVAPAVLLDLKSYKATEFRIPMKGEGELHVALGGSPLTLYAGTPGELRSYLVSEALKGNTTPAAISEINPGSHGAVITHTAPNRLLISDLASFDVVEYAGTVLKASRGLAWDAEGRNGGRNGRPRLSQDGNYVYGSLAATVPAEQWQTRQNDLHIVDLKAEKVRRVALAPGIVGRFQLSGPYALFYNIHPDGDNALLLDTNPASSSFQQVIARVPLAKLTNAPVAGENATGKEARGGAITRDGKLAFVSHGGDGKVSVIDTSQKAVTSTISTPTQLKGGGYLLAIQKGAQLVDTQVR